MSRLLLCAVLCTTAAALNSDRAQGALRSKVRAEGFVRALEFKHRLRVCNAYPYSAALDVYRGTSEKLTDGAPMHYKSCKDFLAPLRSGDKLEFKVGDASAGTFSVSDLPQNDAVLLLVIHRHDTLSTAVSFESHVFANLENAQVAIIDTFKGAAKGSPTIMDVTAKGKTSHSEDLRYDSVVAINPGLYNVHLMGVDGKDLAKSPQLVALNHESYVIIRTGVEAQQGPAYPQELIIYPISDVSLLHSGAPAVAKIPAVAALVALLALSSPQCF
jgi:hypothetical protein